MLSELKIDGNAVSIANSYTFTNVTSNHTITATFSPISYTIKYNGNGATSGTMSNSSHTYGVAKALTANSFSKTGYNFIGWSTSSSATTATYTDGQSVSNLTATNGATVNLYAVWRETLTLTSPTGSPVNTDEISVSITGTLGSGSGDIVYDLYVGGTYKSTVTGATGRRVTLNATGLTTNTTYSCEIRAKAKSNSSVTATSSTVSVKTYACSGTGITTCSGPNAELIHSCPGPESGHTGHLGMIGMGDYNDPSSWSCGNCGNSNTTRYRCTCGKLVIMYCANCGYEALYEGYGETTGYEYSTYFPYEANTGIVHSDVCYSMMCTTCDGGIELSHGNEESTYYCKHGFDSAHSMCSHGYGVPHD